MNNPASTLTVMPLNQTFVSHHDHDEIIWLFLLFRFLERFSQGFFCFHRVMMIWRTQVSIWPPQTKEHLLQDLASASSFELNMKKEGKKNPTKQKKKEKHHSCEWIWVPHFCFPLRGTRCFSLWKKKLQDDHRFQGSCFINHCGVSLLHSIRGLELPENPRIITNCDKGQLEITVLEQFLVCF